MKIHHFVNTVTKPQKKIERTWIAKEKQYTSSQPVLMYTYPFLSNKESKRDATEPRSLTKATLRDTQ